MLILSLTASFTYCKLTCQYSIMAPIKFSSGQCCQKENFHHFLSTATVHLHKIDYIKMSSMQESVTFDPFMSMSVPIPGKLRNLPVFFVPCDPKHLPTKVCSIACKIFLVTEGTYESVVLVHVCEGVSGVYRKGLTLFLTIGRSHNIVYWRSGC